MTLLTAHNKIATTETNLRKFLQSVLNLVGFRATSGWTDLILEYTRLGYEVEATFDHTNSDDDFIIILDIFHTNGEFYKQVIEE